MSEKNYVVNIKNKQGTIFTFRGDSAEELQSNIHGFINFEVAQDIASVEEVILGVPAPAAQSAVGLVADTFGATVISETPTAPAPAFAPVPPPAAPAAATPGARMCQHGAMTYRKGNGAKGEWKAAFCPAPKGSQCDPQWLNRSMPEWNAI